MATMTFNQQQERYALACGLSIQRGRCRTGLMGHTRFVRQHLSPAESVEFQLRRIVALGGSIRQSAWEAAQAQLAAIRFRCRQLDAPAHAPAMPAAAAPAADDPPRALPRVLACTI